MTRDERRCHALRRRAPRHDSDYVTDDAHAPRCHADEPRLYMRDSEYYVYAPLMPQER